MDCLRHRRNTDRWTESIVSICISFCVKVLNSCNHINPWAKYSPFVFRYIFLSDVVDVVVYLIFIVSPMNLVLFSCLAFSWTLSSLQYFWILIHFFSFIFRIYNLSHFILTETNVYSTTKYIFYRFLTVLWRPWSFINTVTTFYVLIINFQLTTEYMTSTFMPLNFIFCFIVNTIVVILFYEFHR